jgi:GxxExxY protein
MLRIPTTLDPAIEELVHQTIGCCITVHRELGPGLIEQVYGRAVGDELAANGIHSNVKKGFQSAIEESTCICIDSISW